MITRRDWSCVHEVFVCSLVVNLWDKNLNIQKKTQFILSASKEVGLEMDLEKNKVQGIHILLPDYWTLP
jgi:hypothetical protein